ncbi:helix-turn-helix domain-containing protein [Sporosarcina aquimarina]|uniref:Helix-turn-helix domain-containing protein n=1 Tax=Sporosarcina aquimarina TaxID=114975 RepID=A0ABU4FYG8_9BACL|nr:helix-turn-helix domain-containing protein [Sporosarcina aquimarina]MDW0109103.1 helix-turn-helix domain-containing protein [Sporosarcina aquimarina]
MKLSSIILKIVEKMDGQRSLNASLHVLRGKRSGQTIQDVDYFSIKPFFSLLPKLQESTFLEAVNELNSHELIIEKQGIIYLTQKGRLASAQLPEFRFDGWNYRGQIETFNLRLLLLVQTLSQVRLSKNSFLPITNDRNVQQFIKELLRNLPATRQKTAALLAAELQSCIKQSEMSELQATVISHRLTGAEASGWTWEQLEEALEESRNSLQLELLEGLHRIIALSETTDYARKLPILHKLAEGIRIETPLTESTVITKKLFDQGLSIDEIAVVRKLRSSTIEDHITEIATNDKDFPILQFVELIDLEAVQDEVNRNEVKRLRLLKEKFPHLSYFQLRLILSTAKGERV